MKLYEIIGIDLNNGSVISVVGGGGKTTTIIKLGEELKGLGKKVLITTSTAIFIPDKFMYDNLFIKNIPENFIPEFGSITYYGEEINDNKLRTGHIESIEEIINRDLFDYILIEADGSKGMPIKAPALHEPVISIHTKITIGLIGLDCINTEINDSNVHRSELIRKLIDEDKYIIDNDVIIVLVLNENGLFRTSMGKKILLLNKANNNFRITQGKMIKEILKDTDISVVIGDVKSNLYIS